MSYKLKETKIYDRENYHISSPTSLLVPQPITHPATLPLFQLFGLKDRARKIRLLTFSPGLIFLDTLFGRSIAICVAIKPLAVIKRKGEQVKGEV